MPTTRPSAFTRAPPELPGLMAASVWMQSTIKPVSLLVTGRFKAETYPTVTLELNWRPPGLPMAITISVTCRSSELPNSAGVSLSSVSIFSTARSVWVSSPTSFAS